MHGVVQEAEEVEDARTAVAAVLAGLGSEITYWQELPFWPQVPEKLTLQHVDWPEVLRMHHAQPSIQQML